ncbi:T9SS type A sorting domain-containing protein, partial [Saprospiraceae bacterium]|nr:T9SS type A sorting domain-containing protein [Saprospiraceae bacterium]
MKQIYLHIRLLSLLFLGTYSFAQENVGQQSFEVVVNTILEGVSVNSMIKPIAVVQPDNGGATFSYSASGVYEMKYTPNADFTGSDYFVAEYYQNSGIPTPKYIHFNIEVKESIINLQADYANTEMNTPVVVSCLDNDIASHGPLTIVGASYITNGSITLINGSEIEFTPEQDFLGNAYVNYLVQDSIGATNSGTIKIGVHDVLNIPAFEEIKIATTNKNPATILLPLSGFELDSNDLPNNGSVTFVGTDVVEYVSTFGNSTLDSFTVTLGTEYSRLIIVETINIPEQNGFVIDDYVITTVNEAVTFDVQANDVKKNFPIVDYTDVTGLVQDSLDESVFTYTPPTGFTGEKVFSYTVTNGVYNETAYITILISNFSPTNNATYNLTTPKNTPLVINYDIPISNFSFIENASPISGTLEIYEGLDTLDIGCDEIIGYNLVTYTPDPDFVGSDQFEILYCVDNSNCELVKVFVEIADIGLDSICLCITDCVWAGDADNDGKVSVADLLPIAYHQGISGLIREEAGTAQSWFGQHADDWNVTQAYNSSDVKHVDSNGDGLVAGDDVLEISSYYNRFHDLVAPDNLVIKDYPFTIETDQDTVYAGELLNLEIHIGSEQYPAINLHGLAYGLTFPSELIDSSTVAVDYLNDEWFGSNSASMEMDVQPTSGRIEAAFSRTSGIPVSGFGIVATVSFIVEDDLQGIFSSKDVIPIDLYLEALKVQGVGGQEFLLPPTKKTLYLDLRGKPKFNLEADINLYPNPSTNHIFIHANRSVEISTVEIFTMDGQLVESKTINYQTARVNVADMNPGIYIAKIETTEGVAMKKFVVN